jgi:metacaspase-1
MAKKTALCIGINDYPGTGSDLRGCVNDARDWQAELERRGFQTTLMLDRQATKQAMASEMQRLLGDAKYGDVLVITYSGHGTWVPDADGDEPDRRDEALVPHDIREAGPLLDDDLFEIFSERERGVRLVMVSDSCHSGTVARFAPHPLEGERPRTRFLAPATFLSQAATVAAERVAGSISRAKSRTSSLLLAGCRDTEYSYDAEFGNKPNGAYTYVALQALKQLPANASYRDWHKAICQQLPSPSYPQSPALQGTAAQKKWAVLT